LRGALVALRRSQVAIMIGIAAVGGIPAPHYAASQRPRDSTGGHKALRFSDRLQHCCAGMDRMSGVAGLSPQHCGHGLRSRVDGCKNMRLILRGGDVEAGERVVEKLQTRLHRNGELGSCGALHDRGGVSGKRDISPALDCASEGKPAAASSLESSLEDEEGNWCAPKLMQPLACALHVRDRPCPHSINSRTSVVLIAYASCQETDVSNLL
jgi:hypothetical protein